MGTDLARHRGMLAVVVESVEESMTPSSIFEFFRVLFGAAVQECLDWPWQRLESDRIRDIDDVLMIDWEMHVEYGVGWKDHHVGMICILS